MERVVKIVSGRYTVDCNGKRYDCTAKGNLKIKANGIVTGDFVETENNVIVNVMPRKNRLLRPNVANIDAVVIVVADLPTPDLYLIDKMIAEVKRQGITAVIAVNKTDISDETLRKIRNNYEQVVDKIFCVSAKSGDGIEEFGMYLKDKLTVFTGQLAVGKTSLLNKLFDKEMRVGEVSRKTERGKQTTTFSEIFSQNGADIIDTPGFSSLDYNGNVNDLHDGYTEIAKVAKNCRFGDCHHINEPNCAVRVAVGVGEINSERYSRYVELFNKLKEKENYGKKR